jgi:CRP-like cAMP-binding protein
MTNRPYRNRILARLSPEALDIVEPSLEPVQLPHRTRLSQKNTPIAHAYFVEDGIVSTAASVRHDVGVEIGIVGFEGMANIALAMGTDQAPNESFMQIPGHGYAIGATPLRAALRQSEELDRIVLQSAHVFLLQVSATVLANGRASVSQRLARWLLMAQDRIAEPRLPLTHEFLAIMLGVRRAGVTVALNELERRGLVAGGRGEVTILDRLGLLAIANGYYGMPERELARLFGAD